MLVSVSKVLGMWAVGLVAAVAVGAEPVSAAPIATGACCNTFLGCCPPDGTCRISTQADCNGIADSYIDDFTTCEGQCPVTTTTTTTTSTSTTTTTTTTSSSSTSTSTSTTTLPLVVICGDANDDKDITSTDALIALRTAVGTSSCSLERCDYNGSGEVTTPDALQILRVAVGQIVVPMCPLVI